MHLESQDHAIKVPASRKPLIIRNVSASGHAHAEGISSPCLRHGIELANMGVDTERRVAVWRAADDIHRPRGLLIEYSVDTDNRVMIEHLRWETPPEDEESAWAKVASQIHPKQNRRHTADDLLLHRNEWADNEGSRLLLQGWTTHWVQDGWADQLDALKNTLGKDSASFEEWMNRLSSWVSARQWGKGGLRSRAATDPKNKEMAAFGGWLAIVAWKYKSQPYVVFPRLTLGAPMEGIDKGMRRVRFHNKSENTIVHIRTRERHENNPFSDINIRWTSNGFGRSSALLESIARDDLQPLDHDAILRTRCEQMLELDVATESMWSAEAYGLRCNSMNVWFEPSSPVHSWFALRESQMDALGVASSFDARWPYWLRYAQEQIHALDTPSLDLPTIHEELHEWSENSP